MALRWWDYQFSKWQVLKLEKPKKSSLSFWINVALTKASVPESRSSLIPVFEPELFLNILSPKDLPALKFYFGKLVNTDYNTVYLHNIIMQNNNQYILQFSREIKISLKKYKRSECNNKV